MPTETTNPAQCAGCRQPIVKNQPFAIWGTEVFHRQPQCIAQIRSSVGTEQKLALKRLEQEILRERREAADARVQAQNAEQDAALAESKYRKQVDETEIYRERWKHAKSTNNMLANSRNQLADRNLELERELSDAKTTIATREVEIARLRNELLKHATDKIPVPQTADPRDDAEIRFSLLEIDKS